jgi:TonB-linked SusC/RagA family outer membrane protein
MRKSVYLLTMVLASHLTTGFGQTFAYYDKNGPDTGGGRQTAGDRKVSLENVLTAIQNKYGISIFYKSNLVENKTVEADFRMAETPDGTLQRVLKPHDLTYKKNGEVYVIVDEPSSPSPEIRKIENRKIGEAGGIGSLQIIDVGYLGQLNASVLRKMSMAINITGTVRDDQGQPLPGVNVLLKGSNSGTTTGTDGTYAITAPDGNGTLVFSFIGFTPQEVAINGRTNIDVALAPDVKALNEVVVVGYGTQDKKDLTTSVVTLNSKDFLPGAFNNPIQMVDGKVPGVTISNPAAADPNRASDIQVRGASSISAGNGPLVIIDGMPGGDLRNVAQQDIESITVLKDGGAAAIYGSRGANGVILVQTKKGAAGKVSVTYDSFIDHDAVARKPEVLSPEEFLQRERGDDIGARTNWYDALLNKRNFGQNHFLAVGGGSENTTFRISGNYRTKSAIDIASDRREYGVRANFQQKAIQGLLELGGNVSYRVVDEEYTDYGAFRQAIWLNPTYPVMDPNDPSKFFVLKGFGTANPVQSLKTRENGADRIYSIFDFNVKLNLLKNLDTQLKLARQGNDMLRREYYNKEAPESIDNARNGRARLENERWTDYTLEWIGNYSLMSNRHDFRVMGGYSYQEFNNSSFWTENANFPTDVYGYNNLGEGDWFQEEGRLGMDSRRSKEKVIAFFGRANYNFDDRYLFSGTLRYEGNTKFGADNKWGLFPAASAAWRLSKMPFLSSAGAVNDLKLRFSYGVTGRSGFDRYLALAKYQGWGQYPNDEGRWIRVYGPSNNPNLDLRWERQISYNLGTDFALFNNRISGSFDAFIRQGKDVISEYDVPVPPYLHDKLWTNVASTSSRGVELSVNWNLIRTGGFSYTTSVVASYIKSKVDKFSNGTYTKGFIDRSDLPSPGNPGFAQRLLDGTEVGSFYGYKYAGVDDDGNIMIWKNGQEGGERINATQEGDKNRDRVFLGNGAPRYDLTWGNTLNYKSFDLTLYFRGRFDYKILNLYQMYYGLQDERGGNLLKDAYDRNGHIESGKVITDYFLENGDFFKLDNLTLGWSPKFQNKYVSGVRIYGTVRNAFTLTKYTGIDPTTVTITGLDPGIGSLDVYPMTRNFSLGAQITF